MESQLKSEKMIKITTHNRSFLKVDVLSLLFLKVPFPVLFNLVLLLNRRLTGVFKGLSEDVSSHDSLLGSGVSWKWNSQFQPVVVVVHRLAPHWFFGE